MPKVERNYVPQSVIIKNINEFFKYQARKNEDKKIKIPKGISLSNKLGVCHGITHLWLYCQLISQSSEMAKRSEKKEKERGAEEGAKKRETSVNDVQWFNDVVELIEKGDFENLTDKQKTEIEIFWSLVLLFQDPYQSGLIDASLLPAAKQMDAYQTIDDTSGRGFNLARSYSGILTREQLAEMIPKMAGKNKMVTLSSNLHTTGLIKIDDVYHFFDSNGVVFSSKDPLEVAEVAFARLELIPIGNSSYFTIQSLALCYSSFGSLYCFLHVINGYDNKHLYEIEKFISDTSIIR